MRKIALASCVLFCCLIPAVNCIDLWPGQACTAIYVYGLSATVIDADTGQPIENAVLTLREGNYVEVMMHLPTGSYAGAGERAGTYNLTIHVPDVATDTIHDITIEEDECHVIGQALEIRVRQDEIIVAPTSFACTQEMRPGVKVKVTRATNNQPMTNAVLTLVEGDYTEQLAGGSGGEYSGAAERRGTYTLVVEAPGFVGQTIDNVVVTQGVCHVNTVELNVKLQPAS